MEINFTGKTALVTGAGKGIGRATAILLAECGANVIALSRTQSDLDSLKEISGNIKTICADLLNWDEAVKAIESTDDRIDLLVNNAAYILPQCSVLDVTEDEINKTIKIRVNCILPGATATPIVLKYAESEKAKGTIARTPRGQMADPKEIAHTIVYLLSEFASNITGAMIASDGGFLAN